MVEDVSSFLTAVNVAGGRRKEIVALARSAAEPDWISSGMPLVLEGMLECERTATEIVNWSPMVIPGLLQTSAYAAEIFSSHELLTPKDVNIRVQARAQRGSILKERRGALPPVKLTAIIGEWGVRQQVGGPQVFAEQLRNVLDLAILPTVTVAEHHRASAFLYDDSRNFISDYQIAADLVGRIALSVDDSAAFIADRLHELEA